MKKIKLYQIDAFTKDVFAGNPAAICPLETWLDDATMQKIAAENNLAETAYFVKEDVQEERVLLSGYAVPFLEGTITLN